ncbi:hypothetical protein EDB19DRAFT_1812608, partial [Suillus lakei]
MWAMGDTIAHHMVKEFYDAMFTGKIDCRNAARALNKASKAVDKDKVPWTRESRIHSHEWSI